MEIGEGRKNEVIREERRSAGVEACRAITSAKSELGEVSVGRLLESWQ